MKDVDIGQITEHAGTDPLAHNAQMVFDTNCVLCSGAVHFILRHERDAGIQFVNAWSPAGLEIAARHGLSREDLDKTVLFVKDGEGFTRSDSVLEIARHLTAPWRWIRGFHIVPRPIRDFLYSAVAQRRYRIFGYRDGCFVPTQDMRHRFVDR